MRRDSGRGRPVPRDEPTSLAIGPPVALAWHASTPHARSRICAASSIGFGLCWSGTFADSSQALGSSNSFDVALGDLDGDGDLDAFVTNFGTTGHANRVWLNQ